jgi:hypothetical protein
MVPFANQPAAEFGLVELQALRAIEDEVAVTVAALDSGRLPASVVDVGYASIDTKRVLVVDVDLQVGAIEEELGNWIGSENEVGKAGACVIGLTW